MCIGLDLTLFWATGSVVSSCLTDTQPSRSADLLCCAPTTPLGLGLFATKESLSSKLWCSYDWITSWSEELLPKILSYAHFRDLHSKHVVPDSLYLWVLWSILSCYHHFHKCTSLFFRGGSSLSSLILRGRGFPSVMFGFYCAFIRFVHVSPTKLASRWDHWYKL